MDKDKITIVSGEPRSGTSLMMQTLKELGLDVTGEKNTNKNSLDNFKDENGKWKYEYIDKKEEIERRAKHSEMMNPVGFYEVSSVVSTGVRGIEAQEFKGKVVKIITSGIPSGAVNRTSGTDKKYIDKIILCVRNPKNIAVSQKNLVDNSLLIAKDDDWVYHNDAPPSPLSYLNRTGSFIIWLNENPEMKERILTVEYEDMHTNPGREIARIIAFLDIDPIEENIKNAVYNVKPHLNRSKLFKEWPEKFKDEGEMAMNIYEAMTTLSEEKIAFVSALLEERRRLNMLEHISWIDCDDGQGTWVSVNADLYRRILRNKNNLRTNLLNNTNRGFVCSYYAQSDKTYTIERPKDLGDLTRSMVWCNRDEYNKTIEECSVCWSVGWNRNGKILDPQMNSTLESLR